MCGIAGYFGKELKDEAIIDRTFKTLHHRGPDSKGYYHVSDDLSNNLYLLHTRLNILDVEKRSNQPYRLGSFTLIFNGEIYNYLEIKAMLVKEGVSFDTTGDTEVLARALVQWGIDVTLDRLEGMWAFAFYNKNSGNLYLCRDRFGEKPLYFSNQNDGIYFSSETKSLFQLLGRRLDFNFDQIHRYLINGYKSIYKHNSTFYNEVQEVNQGQWVKINKDLKLTVGTYWKPNLKVNETLNYVDSVEKVREDLRRSVSLRLRSDVPIAFCMSGGIDSNALISMASREKGFDVHGFTIVNSDERYDEGDLVKKAVADLGIAHTSIPLEKKNFLEDLKTLVNAHDCPVYTITYFLHWKLMKAISEAGFKVSISGTGADELFTGYYDHGNLFLNSMYDNSDTFSLALEGWKKNHLPYARNEHLRDPYLYINNPNFREHIYDDSKIFSSFLNKEWHENYQEKNYGLGLLRNRMLNELFHEIVPVILHEDDLNAMYFSVENRSPFLDRQLFETAFSIPEHHLIKNGIKKSVLRDAVRSIVSESIINNPKKIGFNAPIEDLLDTSDPKVREFLLDDSQIFDLINKKKIEELSKKKKLSNSESKFIFNFLNIKIFLESAK
ncbi:asparagine synthase (glutamine-hydrolyzing) [Candidatus Pelagibacter sp.]|nr:asparagine synthase (glutamine-hydrolyzing) [Candidatus Pelagibacter sp.]